MRIETPSSQASSTETDPSPVFTTITRGDYADAFERGYEVTQRFLMSRGINKEAAEEVAQAAWAKGWEYRRQLRDTKRVVTWVNSIAMNLFRKIFRRPNTVELPLHVSIPAQACPDAIDAIRMLSRCSHADRELLSKYYAEGYTSQELAGECGCTDAAIRVRLLRLRRRMQLFGGSGRQISMAAAGPVV